MKALMKECKAYMYVHLVCSLVLITVFHSFDHYWKVYRVMLYSRNIKGNIIASNIHYRFRR